MEIVALPTAVSRPLVSQVNVGTDVDDPADPAVSSVGNVVGIVMFAVPSKAVAVPVTSPFKPMVRAVASLVDVAALPVVEALPM